MSEKRTFKKGIMFKEENIDLAPCQFGEGYGRTFTLPKEDKSGICVCPKFVCSVNGRNQVIECYSQTELHPYLYLAGTDGVVTHTDALNFQLKLWSRSK